MPRSLSATFYRQFLQHVRKIDQTYEQKPAAVFHSIFGLWINLEVLLREIDPTVASLHPHPLLPPAIYPPLRPTPAATESTTTASSTSKSTSTQNLRKRDKIVESPSLTIAKRLFRSCIAQQNLAGARTAGGESLYPINSEMVKMFWLLRQCQAALPVVPPAEDPFVDRKTVVEFLGKELQAARHSLLCRTVLPQDGETHPLPRHCIPQDPIWLLQLQRTESFPLIRECLAMEVLHNTPQAPGRLNSSATVGTKNPLGPFCYLLSSTAFTNEFLRDQFNLLPMQTVTQTDGIVEIAIRTEYVSLVRRPGGKANKGGKMMSDDEEEDGSTGSSVGEPKFVNDIEHSREKDSLEQVFNYYVAIRNISGNPSNPQSCKEKMQVTLMSRHWQFFDIEGGTTTEVTGAGVVGQFPSLLPGESHTYVSGTTMKGRYGWMKGKFQFAVQSLSGKVDVKSVKVLTAEETSSAKSGQKGEKKKKGKKGSQQEDPTESLSVQEETDLEDVPILNATIDATRLSVGKTCSELNFPISK
jgi:uncharacterized protein affecting Mg2+/Co2+ transport